MGPRCDNFNASYSRAWKPREEGLSLPIFRGRAQPRLRRARDWLLVALQSTEP